MNNDFYFDVFNDVTCPLVLFDNCGEFKEMNNACRDIFLSQSNCIEWVTPELKIFLEHGDEHFRFSKQLQRSDVQSSFEVNMHRYTNLDGALVGVSIALSENNLLLDDSLGEAQRIAKIGHWVFDVLDNILLWSDEVYRIFGEVPRSFEATYDTFLDFIHPDDRKLVESAYAESLESKGKYQVSHRIILKSGEIRYVEERGEHTLDSSGNVKMSVGTVMDITEVELYRQKLMKKIEDEEAKRKEQDLFIIHQSRLAAIGEMIGNIAHQWRQPLNTLALLVYDLEDAYLYGELHEAVAKESFGHMTRTISEMSKTIDDFRNFFSPSTDKVHFNLQECIEDCMQLLEAGMLEYGIDVVVIGDIDFTVEGYLNEFSQVVLVLLSNARDAMERVKLERKQISIRLSYDKSKSVVRILFDDNGTGIPSEIRSSIFNPYFTTKHKDKGVGVGLYMAKMIVEKNMNGKIYYQGLDQGSRFVVELKVGKQNEC